MAGLRVLRGPDWLSGDTDGGEGHLGTVTSMGGEGTAEVLWDNGKRNTCRIGKDGNHDLRIFDNATIGVRHTQVTCDGCDERGIYGMRWVCTKCKCCNLCPVCYVSDKHDLSHEFIRYDRPGSEGVNVKKRSSSQRIQAAGLFSGAIVTRGSDWASGDQDGGPGSKGKVVSVENNPSASSVRNVVRVRWSNGNSNIYRVGHEGKVDLKFVEESPGTYYYKDHLPLLDFTESSKPKQASAQPDVLKEGERVCIKLSPEVLKAVQNDHGGWAAGMANCIGKIGVVKGFTPGGDATVEFDGFRFRFFPGALRKIADLSVGDIVRIDSDEEKIKVLQDGHGVWNKGMTQILGKCGRIVKVDSDGDVIVAFGRRTWLFNPACCTPAAGQKIYEMEETSSESSSTEGTSDVHDALLNLMAGVLARGAAGRMRGGNFSIETLYQAIGQRNTAAVKSIISKNPSLLNETHSGITPLNIACHEGQTDIVKVLLDQGANLDTTDHHGNTALMVAISGKKEAVAKLLIERGANCKIVNQAKRTALHFAAYTNVSGVMIPLIQHGCNVNLQDATGDTALHDAIQEGNKGATEILLRAAKLDLKVTDKKGFNPLHLSALRNRVFAVEGILRRDSSLTNVKTSTNEYASLHIAAVNDHVECARLLIDDGKAIINIRGSGEATPLHLACNEGYFKTAELLVQKGADPNLQDSKGNTPLHLAIAASRNKGDQALLAALLGLRDRNEDEVRVRIACLLLQKNAIVDIKNRQGRTPLECAKNETIRNAVNIYIQQNKGTIRRTPAGQRAGSGAAFHSLLTLPCARCLCKLSNITVKPCGHKVLCRECCLQVQNCPVCEQFIERRIAEGNAGLEEPCKVQ